MRGAPPPPGYCKSLDVAGVNARFEESPFLIAILLDCAFFALRAAAPHLIVGHHHDPDERRVEDFDPVRNGFHAHVHILSTQRPPQV